MRLALRIHNSFVVGYGEKHYLRVGISLLIEAGVSTFRGAKRIIAR
jgi:hypothetical protein